MKRLTFSGPGPRRLPVGLLVARAEDDPRPAHVVEPGETIDVDDDLAGRLLAEPFWSTSSSSSSKSRRGGSRSAGGGGDTMSEAEDGSAEEEDS